MTLCNIFIVIYVDDYNGSIFIEDFRNLGTNDTEYKIQKMKQDERWLEECGWTHASAIYCISSYSSSFPTDYQPFYLLKELSSQFSWDQSDIIGNDFVSKLIQDSMGWWSTLI